MRGCLGFIGILLVTLAVMALLAVELVLPRLVEASVRDSPYFRGQPVAIEVDTSVPGLLRGVVDRVTISGQNLQEDGATVGSLEATLFDVSLLSRLSDRVAGTLTSVSVGRRDRVVVPLDSVQLSGPSGALTATADITSVAAVKALEDGFRAAGLPVSSVTLETGGLAIGFSGLTLHAGLAIVDGSLVIEPVPAEIVGIRLPQVTIVPATTNQAWRLTAVDVTPGGVRISADVIEPAPS